MLVALLGRGRRSSGLSASIGRDQKAPPARQDGINVVCRQPSARCEWHAGAIFFVVIVLAVSSLMAVDLARHAMRASMGRRGGRHPMPPGGRSRTRPGQPEAFSRAQSGADDAVAAHAPA